MYAVVSTVFQNWIFFISPTIFIHLTTAYSMIQLQFLLYYCLYLTANEGSGETSQKETSTCDICQFGAECDEDAEDVW